MEIVAAIVIATLIGPFLIGWWIGNPAFAAAAWGALGLTVLIRQAQLDTSEGLAFAVDRRRDRDLDGGRLVRRDYAASARASDDLERR